MTRTARLRPAVVAVLLAPFLSLTLGVAPGNAGPAASETPELVVVLDSSGSMAEADAGGGQTRMEAAKQAVVALAQDAPASSRIGLRTYGDGVDSEAPGSCEDTTLRVPVGPVDRAAITSQVQSLSPRGDTPIGTALRAAAGDLTGTGPRSVVLVSDGEPTCDPDPCVVAGELAVQGVDLRIDVVGFRVDEDARRILQCVADAGGGRYVDAADAGDLTEALDTSLDRGFRVYQPEGTPVQGSLTPEGAPVLAEGQYLDAIAVDAPVHYLVDVPRGWTMRAGVTITRGDDPQRRGVRGYVTTTVDTTSPDPVQCAFSPDSTDNQRGSSPLSGSVMVGPGALSTYSWMEECEQEDQFLLTVDWTISSSPGPFPMEVLVQLEPPVVGTEGLGTEGDETTVFPELQPLPDPSPVDGGPSFNDATLLEPGAWSDSMRLGETVFYRVPVDWGQQLAVRVDFPPTVEGSALDDALRLGNYANLLLFDETRGHAYPIGSKSTRYVQMEDEGGYMAITTHPVTWANRGETVYNEVRRLSRPGDLYLMLSMDSDETSGDEIGLAVPYTVSVDVLGDPQPGPRYATTAGGAVPSAEPSEEASEPAPSSAPEPSEDVSPAVEAASGTEAGRDGSGGALLPVLVGAASLLAALLVALVLWGWRTTRSGARTG
ncbi:vWA domain-containing protein [Aquipuribacter hungaricus]|uniref:VWA domain-containing protein n=1 Tax=Aquipuribacter hungaricus TaxID=545624 RepID=A0ABV7WGA5_9MICO